MGKKKKYIFACMHLCVCMFAYVCICVCSCVLICLCFMKNHRLGSFEQFSLFFGGFLNIKLSQIKKNLVRPEKSKKKKRGGDRGRTD